MKIYIYQIWFPTSKKSYIGQTCNLQKRIKGHLRSGSLVCKALWKYDDWQITILHTTNKELANQLEIEDIRNHNSIAPNGYNLTAGGEGGDIFVNNPNRKEITKRMSESHKGKKKLYVSESNKRRKGAKRPDVTKRNKENNSMKNSITVLKYRISYLKNKIAELK